MARAKVFPSPVWIPIVSQRPVNRTEVLRERARKRYRGQKIEYAPGERARELVSIGARDKRGHFLPKRKRLTVPEVAIEVGINEAIEYARRLDWNPDNWATEVSEHFNVSQHNIYQVYYGYEPDGAGTW